MNHIHLPQKLIDAMKALDKSKLDLFQGWLYGLPINPGDFTIADDYSALIRKEPSPDATPTA